MVIEILVIVIGALCGQAMWMFGPRLLDDVKKIEELQLSLNIADERMNILESEVRELKDRLNKQQLKGLGR